MRSFAPWPHATRAEPPGRSSRPRLGFGELAEDGRDVAAVEDGGEVALDGVIGAHVVGEEQGSRTLGCHSGVPAIRREM